MGKKLKIWKEVKVLLECEYLQKAVRGRNLAFMAAVDALEEAAAIETLLHSMWYVFLFYLYLFVF